MRTKTVPPNARHLRHHEELRSHLDNFTAKIYPFIWIIGRSGTAKTESVKAAVRGKNVYYRKGGQLTPAQFHIDCFHHRGLPIILDDAEYLLDNTVGAKPISALGDTTPEKLLCYGTTSRVLGDVPPIFSTTSSLCIISNTFAVHEAVRSRAVTLYFDPTNREIHSAVAAWFWDQEIHNWFGEHLYRLPPLDARWYCIAHRDKTAGRDWRQIMLKTHALDRASCIIQNLETDPAYPTREDKARRFLELLGNAKGASRASYFRLRRRLEDAHCLVPQVVTTIRLRRTTPPGTPTLWELEVREAARPTQPEEEARPIDVPVRDQFVQPIRGDIAPVTAPPRQVLDDTVPWERPTDPDDDEADV